MTAINPARLKIQAVELCEHVDNPDRFITGLHDFLSFYAARIRQTSFSQTPLTLRVYQVSPPVLRALEQELENILTHNLSEGLTLVDALWADEWLEIRQLAVFLLGNLETRDPEIIISRVKIWLDSCTAETIRRLIMTLGLARLSQEKSELVLAFFQELINSSSKGNRQAALFGLLTFSEDPAFDNLPVIFNSLNDILLVEETGLVKEISALLKSLQKRSEQETSYFLIRQLTTASKPRILRVVRLVLPGFSGENKALLTETLHNFT